MRIVTPPRTLVNGRSEKSVPADDRGLNYADGLFETIRVVRGRLCRHELHFERMREGLARLRIAAPDAELLGQELNRLVGGESGVLRITITRGSGRRGYAIPPEARPRRIATFQPCPIPQWPEDGCRLTWCDTRIALQPALGGIKHLGRLEQVLARAEVDEQGADEGIMLTPDGRMVECTASNLFLVREGRVLTPKLTDCGVAGVMRRWIMGQLGEALAVTDLEPEALTSASEVFIANSIAGVGSVVALGPQQWPVGEIATNLRQQDRKECLLA